MYSPSDYDFKILEAFRMNYLVPMYAVLVCIWATVVVERWKRKRAELVQERAKKLKPIKAEIDELETQIIAKEDELKQLT